jgi:predicted PurR-regulated permease PerM
MSTKEKSFNRLDYTVKVLMVIALIILGVTLAQDIVVPLLISGILTVVLIPAVKRLEKKFPSTLAISIVLLTTFILFLLAGLLIVNQFTSLVKDLPNLETKFNLLIDQISSSLQSELGMSIREQNQLLKNSLSTLGGYATGVLTATTNVISLLIQIPIYIFLFLIYRDRFKLFFRSFLSKLEDEAWKKDIENVVQGYISGLLLVTIIVAILNSIGLLLIGIEHAIFFGILSGILTIIPYIGIFIGAALPVIMSLLTKDSLWYPAGVIIIFSVVQFLEGNFITPKITGSKVSINALAAIIALLIGGKILGIAGMILAVPALGVIKIILSHTTHLKPFVILIDDAPIKMNEGMEESEPGDQAPV